MAAVAPSEVGFSLSSLRHLHIRRVQRSVLIQVKRVVALVNGSAITRADVDAYALVFRDPNGYIRATDAQILEALIVQSLVHDEVRTRGILISEADVDAYVDGVVERSAMSASIQRGGGLTALRRRVRAFLEFKEIKRVVTASVDVTDNQVREAYEVDARLHSAPLVEVAPMLETRMEHEAIESAWAGWVHQRRRCANVVVVRDMPLQVVSAASPTCGVGP